MRQRKRDHSRRRPRRRRKDKQFSAGECRCVVGGEGREAIRRLK